MPKKFKELMNIDDLAEYLGYTKRTIYKLIKEEGLPATKIRTQYRAKKSMVDKWIEDKIHRKEDNT
jgi:excisionase family DNA binding protein